MSVTITRRRFVACLLAAGIAPTTIIRAHSQHELWLSASGKDGDHFGLAIWDVENRRIRSLPSGVRGHGMAQHPRTPERIVMFSRHPGELALLVNLRTGTIERRFECSDGRRFSGHGCFSADGRYLYAAESDIESGTGIISVRDTTSFRVSKQFLTHGIGVHEIKLMPDGATLVAANGGIMTRPQSGEKKLNLDSMQSSLVYLDAASGTFREQVFVAEPKASLRHVDVARDGSVAIAMQVQREAMSRDDTVALAAIHKRGQKVRLLNAPVEVIAKMNDYIGSVTINQRSRIAGFTSPRGNLAAFWHVDTEQFMGYHAMHDVCGVTTSLDQRHFVLSNSFGELRQLDAYTLKENIAARIKLTGVHWDNHLMTAQASQSM